MAYREVAMWEILLVLERLHRGERQAAVARVTGHGRKTFRRYLATAGELGWEPGTDFSAERLPGEVYRLHRPVKNRGPGGVEAELLPHLEQLRAWLIPGPGEKRGLTQTKVQRLLDRQGVRIPYSSLHRFAVKHCDFGRQGPVTVRMAPCAPGELAEVDFGELGRVRDRETGRDRVAWALAVVLVHSRHQYVHGTYSQRLRDVIDRLEDAWHFFGGVPRRVVLGNLRPAVTKADGYDPVFQLTCEEYARFRGFVLDAARSADPQGEPCVERGVPYVREDFFWGERWLGLYQVAGAWRRRGPGSAGRPLGVLENVERSELLPLASIHRSGGSTRSIRTTTSAFSGPSNRCPMPTWAGRYGCGASGSSSASAWTGSW